MLYIVPKTFYWAHVENEAMTASVYGQFCSKISQIII